MRLSIQAKNCFTIFKTLTDVIAVVEEAGSETVGKGEDDGGGQPAPEDILVTQVMEHCWLEEGGRYIL